MSYILGLTGGIGSGKSVATRVLSSLGVDIVDADTIARTIVSIGSPTLNKICAYFGHDILLCSGELNRLALRERIFSNSQEKCWLECLLHPLINKTIIDELSNIRSIYGVLSSPLLFETEQYKEVDKTLVIDCPEEKQIQLTIQREQMTRGEVEKIRVTQLSRIERNNKADNIIHNTGSINELQQAIIHYHEQLLQCVST